MRGFYGFVAMIILSLSACSVVPERTLETRERVIVELSGASDEVYYLVGRDGRRYAASVNYNDKLHFRVNTQVSGSGCYFIANDDGDVFSKDPKFFALNKISGYQNLQSRYSYYQREIQAAKNTNRSHAIQMSRVISSLGQTRAYQNGSCERPRRKPYPPMPKVKCGTHAQCTEEGSAICFTRFVGSEGCSYALSEYKVPGLLSSPGCAALAAELAEEKYELGDAFVDAIHGVVDDIAREQMNSDSILSQAFGAVIYNEKTTRNNSAFIASYLLVHRGLCQWLGNILWRF